MSGERRLEELELALVALGDVVQRLRLRARVVLLARARRLGVAGRVAREHEAHHAAARRS